ncbi:Acyl transferase/acyl hydrolase/lysophospholipase [Penicillium expansum]|nr:Acyl transferase/acyl hydrolase/lysophospholipase [Penicillium expansum]
MMMNDDTERKLARTLLMELMVYQFASPVRWIETQDVIVSRTETERIIVVGPSATLLGMLRKTIDTTHPTKECTLPAPRQLLHSEKDMDDIYYTGEPNQLNPVETQTQKETQMLPPNPEAALLAPTVTMEVTTTALPPKVHIKVIDIEDQSIQAQDILFAIVARALKRSAAEIDGSKSIKALAEGKYFDIPVEFGLLPDRAEDLPLAQVGPEIQSSHKGGLGKVTTAMINSLFTAKMPSNFTVATAREQLHTQWGLQSGSQDACLLCAVTMQPTSRIAAESDARDFISRAVDVYAKREGLTLLPPEASHVSGAAIGVTMDPEAVRALTESQDALSKRLLEIYAAHLGVDLEADRQALDSLRDEIATGLQADLNLWHAEHGSDYAQGIRPRFDAKMIRSYDSAWNWARQSLLELFDLTSTVADTSMLDRAEVVKRCYHIANASDKTILPVLDEMISQLQDRSQLRPIFQTLKDNCTDSLLSGPAIKGAPRQMARVTTMDDQGSLQYQEQPRTEVSRFADLAMPRSGPAGNPLVATEPYLHLKKRSASRWEYSAELTRHLYQALHEVETQGDSLSAQTVLITGAGIGSIGAAMIMHFLQGGARVLVTTSSMSPQVAQKYQALHGTFGGDGLYSESKLALETLFNSWYSENWQDYLSICGAVIGWTRGTGLMNQNDLVAEGIEKAGMRTFSQEMAYALVCLCVGPMYELCQEAPASCDKNLKDRSEIQAALFQEDKIEAEWSSPVAQAAAVSELEHRAHVRQDFPRVQEYDRDIAPLSADMQGMVDLHRTVVVMGFSELGPHGNARTRWEMEAQGKFSLEGARNGVDDGFHHSLLWKMFNGRFTGQEVQSDILQETFVNTISAWVNMLLLSASGPIRTPVGACATAVESLELGYDTIVTGKAKFCLVGGCDDFTSETSYEFANMKATTNSLDEIARGRAPSEMSRPTTTTRNGFIESQGCGLQVLTTADLALKMGLPIRGIVAFVSTSSDKAGRSVPAPGQGVLVNARRTTSASNIPSPLLKMSNRHRLNFRRKQISEARAVALDQLDFEVNVVLEQDPGIDVVTYRQERHEQILGDFLQEERDAQYSLGNDFWRHDSSIAPLTGALATWGLTIDDLRVASFHGTSTMMNDKNESSVLQQQLTALGRRNRNADNIDSALQQYDLIAYLNRPVHVPDLKAVSITSFGFGQKGAQAICVHPRLKFSSNEQS